MREEELKYFVETMEELYQPDENTAIKLRTMVYGLSDSNVSDMQYEQLLDFAEQSYKRDCELRKSQQRRMDASNEITQNIVGMVQGIDRMAEGIQEINSSLTNTLSSAKSVATTLDKSNAYLEKMRGYQINQAEELNNIKDKVETLETELLRQQYIKNPPKIKG
jgi:methyl-accepting chemotaxis protein